MRIINTRISFVIPARNEQDQIGAVIEHILKQPPELVQEIIVADNGSTDKTAETAARYPKVKIVYEPTPGTNRARQAGFKASTGDIVAFIDADNWVAPDWSRTALEHLNKPGVVAVAGMYDFRDQNKIARFFSFYGFLLLAYPAYLLVHYFLRLGSVVQGGNFAAKREALEKMGGLDVNYTFYGDDTRTGKQLRKLGRVLFVPSLITTASSRRFRKHGYFRVLSKYFLNFAWVILFNRPFTRPK